MSEVPLYCMFMQGCCYRGTLLMRNSAPLGPYSIRPSSAASATCTPPRHNCCESYQLRNPDGSEAVVRVNSHEGLGFRLVSRRSKSKPVLSHSLSLFIFLSRSLSRARFRDCY